MCWCLSIIELKNARWKIEIRVLSNLSQYTLPQDFLWFLMQIQINIYEMWWSVVFTDGYKSLSWNLLLWNCHEDSSFEMSVTSYQTLLLHLKKDPNIQRRESFACNAAAHRLPTHQNNRIPYAVNISVSRSWWWAKYCPKHVELIL